MEATPMNIRIRISDYVLYFSFYKKAKKEGSAKPKQKRSQPNTTVIINQSISQVNK